METDRGEFSISDLAREFDVTPRAIRFYEDQGLLAPRRDGQRRIYTPRDRTRLKLTLRGKRLGLSLSEIRELIDMYEPGRDERPQLERFLSVLRPTRRACFSSVPISRRSFPSSSKPLKDGSESSSRKYEARVARLVDVYVNVKYAPRP